VASRAWRLGALGALLATACSTDRSAVNALQATLDAQPSATLALEGWCAARGIAQPARITARLVRDEDAPPPADARVLLGLGPNELLRYRHVRLVCGTTVLSEAYNWYVPAALTAAMNASLDRSDTPFGKVVAPLRFQRERLDRRWAPLPGCPRATVLADRALLKDSAGRAFALLVECYTRGSVRQHN